MEVENQFTFKTSKKFQFIENFKNYSGNMKLDSKITFPLTFGIMKKKAIYYNLKFWPNVALFI